MRPALKSTLVAALALGASVAFANPNGTPPATQPTTPATTEVSSPDPDADTASAQHPNFKKPQLNTAAAKKMKHHKQ